MPCIRLNYIYETAGAKRLPVYERFIPEQDAFIADKHIVNSGYYTIECNGKAELSVFAMYHRDGKPAGRSDAMSLFFNDETGRLPVEWLQKDGEMLRAAFRVHKLKGHLNIGYHKN